MTSADRLNQLLTVFYSKIRDHERGSDTSELEANKTLRLMWETFEGPPRPRNRDQA